MPIRNLWAEMKTFESLGGFNFGFPWGNGKIIWLDPANGSDSFDGTTPDYAFDTLAAAYAAATAGKNDTIILIGDGTTAATARVDAAFTWAKNATHLVGICSPALFSQRARIAPTATATAFANFFTVSATGCYFRNIQWFHGFNTGTTSAIAMTVTGSRNVFQNCHIGGMGDAASAQNTGSRSLKVGGSGAGENVFNDCVIGIDTVTRTVANASLELYGATPRNVFRRCTFPFMTSAAGVLGILGTGNGCVDRATYFHECLFVNAVKSTSTVMTVLGSFTTASPGGLVVFDSGCLIVGITDFGDTNFLANGVTGASAPSNSAGGIAVTTT